MRRRGRIDANQLEIVRALRKAGATVTSLANLGGGVPDILVGYRGQNWLFEIKDGSKVQSAIKLTADEAEWLENWRGQADVVYSAMDVLAKIGAIHAEF